MTTGDVEITILDGGSGTAVVPGASVQVVIGTCSAGTAAQIIATQNPNTLVSSLGYGLLPEAGGLSALAGGTILALKAATITDGKVLGSDVSPLTVSAASDASPISVDTSSAHGLITGAEVTITGVGGNTAANGTFIVTVVDSNTFTLNGSTGNSAYTSGGSVQPTGVHQIGTGTSVVTITGNPYDDYNVKFLVTTGGTIGTGGIQFRFSLDAGRNYGPILALGTASTYAIANTGLTLNFAAGTLVAGDYVQFSTVAPATDTTSILACLNALKASQYAVTGWGSMHITGIIDGADAATIEGYLDSLATNFVYTRTIGTDRDASPPAAWGGTGESEATWMAALATSYGSANAKRVCANGGFYNMPSAFPNPVAGSPRFRRPLSFALAARQVQIPPQRHAGRVRDGSLSNIVVDPTNDPLDGFIYHDERINPGLNAARFSSARTRVGLPGFYIVNPNLMSQLGSVFTILPLGNVMDVACAIVHQVGQQEINDDIRLNPNGTIYENEARAIENTLLGALNVAMVATSEISSASVTVNRTTNVLATSTVVISVTIEARGYVLEEDISIGFQSPFAAQAS